MLIAGQTATAISKLFKFATAASGLPGAAQLCVRIMQPAAIGPFEQTAIVPSALAVTVPCEIVLPGTVPTGPALPIAPFFDVAATAFLERTVLSHNFA